MTSSDTKTLEENLDANLLATIDPTNAIAFLEVLGENENILKINKLTGNLQSPDVVDILEIYLSENLAKWEAEQEMESDLLNQARVAGVQLGDYQKGLFMRKWRHLQQLETNPKTGEIGYFFTLEADRETALERYNPSLVATVKSAMIAQSIVDNPRIKGKFTSHAEANTGSCNTLIPQIRTASF